MAQTGRARSGSNPTDPRCGSPAIALRAPALLEAGQKASIGSVATQVHAQRFGTTEKARIAAVTKKNIKFNRDRHRTVKRIREIGRSLRELESAGLVKSRVNPFSGSTEWRITENGLREAADLASLVKH
jgi:hypothetical protein